MPRILLVLAFLVFGSFAASQSFAGGHGDPGIHEKSKGAGDHHSMMMYYEEQEQKAKSKMRDWEFAADYYEKFPGAFTGKMSVSEHVAHCRAIAEEFKKDAERYAGLAEKHRSLMRKDVM
jgi:hypothetical protein